MFEKVLFIKSIDKLFDKNGKVYYQLVVNKLILVLVGLSVDEQLMYPPKRDYTLIVFSNSGYAYITHYLDKNIKSSSTNDLDIKKAVPLTESFYDSLLECITTERVHLFTALESGEIKEGFWLCGDIIHRRVEPYKIGGKTVKYYTLPMVWDDLHLTVEQKESRIKREFYWKGRILAEGTPEEWAEEDEEEEMDRNYEDPWRNVTNSDAFDDPSDQWNID